MSDPLYRDIPLDLESRYPVMGVTTTFLSNSAEAMEVVRHTYSDWERLEGSACTTLGTVPRVRIIVQDPAPPRNLGALHFRVPDSERLLVAGSPYVGVADTVRLDSWVQVTADLVSRPEVFVEGILEPLVLTLLGSLDRQPFHASAVVREGVAILLAGSSGSGKSTLAYAACRSGYSLLADEAVYVQLHPHLRIWGRHSRISLTEGARDYFPELESYEPRQLFSGKSKITMDVPAACRSFFCDRVALCILGNFRQGRPRIASLSSEEAVAILSGRREEGFDLYRSSAPQRIRALAQRGAWLLEPGQRPDQTVSLFEDLVAAVR